MNVLVLVPLLFGLAGHGPLEARDPVQAKSAPAPSSGADEPGADAALPAAPADVARPPGEGVRPQRPASGRSELYRIGPDDVLKVDVLGHPEFGATSTVTSRSTLVLPIVHEVAVGGLTADEVQERLRALLADGYIRDPQPLVEVVEYNNMKVWVFGYVAQPGERRLTGPMTVLELLSLVGDVQSNAGSVLTIERTEASERTAPDGTRVPVSEADTIEVDLDALLRRGDLTQNVELRNGDKVYVPSNTARLGVFGEVVKPGYYTYRDGITLSELIQLAGGLTEYANPKKIRIKRASVPKPISVNLKSFYKDGVREANVPLSEGDLVLVNSSFLF